MRLLTSCAALLVAFALSPATVSACERCFGAGSDAPAVAAVSASMFALLIVISSVFVGVVGFFRNVQRRTEELEAAERRTPPGASSDPAVSDASDTDGPDSSYSIQ